LLGFAHDRNISIDSRLAGDASSSVYSHSRRSSIPIATSYAHEQTIAHAPKQSMSSIDFSVYSGSSPSKSERSRQGSVYQGSVYDQPPPSMTVQLDGHPGVQRTLSDDSLLSASSQPKAQRPKSPGSRLQSFFGWNTSQKTTTESPTTTFSDRSISPLPSPSVHKHLPPGTMETLKGARLTPPGLDIRRANAHRSLYGNQDTPVLLGSPETNAHVKELERELAHVSAELAGSIKREMELEDELERIRTEMPTIPPAELTRRSSDYFSDSGASSLRYPVSDPDAKLEELEQKLRKAEQEKAQIKVDMASRLQDELARRRDLEQMVHDLEEQLKSRLKEEDAKGDVQERLGELESSLEETKRRLTQERQAKDSFGDLYSATRLELEQHKNERDNLRDEIVPQLRSRIEGLEADMADKNALMYENTRMQQELATLREELQKAQAPPRDARFTSIAEESEDISPVAGPRSSLSRSNSLARNRNVRGSIIRSNSVKGEGRQRSGSIGPHAAPPADGFEDIEKQRDALHQALKLLITRHEKQQREHARAVKKLIAAKEDAERLTPRRSGYHREVSFLKEEVATLRKRTEDALEQKWQYEKGLSGLKMDLDRAEQETRSLRSLLQEHDISAPNRQSLLSAYSDSSDPADYSLKVSVTHVENERDHARQIAEDYRRRAQSTDEDNANELMRCASRMDQLAEQLDEQVELNKQLRDRLAKAVEKGEREQKESTRQIEEMQKRLAGMEDSVLAAQQHSETMLGNHEAEVRRIDEASTPALQRLRISIPEPKKLAPASPLIVKSPRLSRRPSETSLLEASKTQMLERKVRELERLLKEAEDDMQTVVTRVNKSQMEVAELQTERDAAFTQMRKLQDLIVVERERAEALMQ
jgi:chromosome segregation ATPase